MGTKWKASCSMITHFRLIKFWITPNWNDREECCGLVLFAESRLSTESGTHPPPNHAFFFMFSSLTDTLSLQTTETECVKVVCFRCCPLLGESSVCVCWWGKQTLLHVSLPIRSFCSRNKVIPTHF